MQAHNYPVKMVQRTTRLLFLAQSQSLSAFMSKGSTPKAGIGGRSRCHGFAPGPARWCSRKWGEGDLRVSLFITPLVPLILSGRDHLLYEQPQNRNGLYHFAFVFFSPDPPAGLEFPVMWSSSPGSITS